MSNGELKIEFEKKIGKKVRDILIYCDFNEFKNMYFYCDLERKEDFNLGVINGTWWMFQELNKKLEPLKKQDGTCAHFSTTMFDNGRAECFNCGSVVNEKREVLELNK